jgi:hypothetical protein
VFRRAGSVALQCAAGVLFVQDRIHRHRRERLIAKADGSGGRHRRPAAPLSAGEMRTPLHTTLAIGTFVWALIYFPIESYVSWAVGGLLRFHFFIDLLGILLLCLGALSAWRAEPRSPAVLAAAWGWTAANFWRGTMERFWTVGRGGTLYAGSIELWLGPALTSMAILMLGASLWLAWRDQLDERRF